MMAVSVESMAHFVREDVSNPKCKHTNKYLAPTVQVTILMQILQIVALLLPNGARCLLLKTTTRAQELQESYKANPVFYRLLSFRHIAKCLSVHSNLRKSP